jgi:quercetin dioxygenase-like cupin family protein
MEEPRSSCELGDGAAPKAGGSRVLRFQPGFRWEGVPATEYKQAADNWRGVTRVSLVGGGGEATRFHLRYFEIAPGGFSSYECHRHEHAVVVLRGAGQVRLGEAVHAIGFGDTVYVAPNEAHQFRNLSESEPLGFLCVVDAERDAPVPLSEKDQSERLRPH